MFDSGDYPKAIHPMNPRKIHPLNDRAISESVKKALLSLAAIAITLLAGETVVRVFDLGPDLFKLERGMLRLSVDPDIRYELVPNYRSPSGDVAINAAGFREIEWPAAPDPATWRIALIGDSIAFGMGGPAEASLARQLETRLHAPTDHATTVCYSFGVPGYNITQVARTLETRVAELAPQSVLYVYCLNDLQEYSRELESLFATPTVSGDQRRWIERQWGKTAGWRPRSELWQLAKLTVDAATSSPRKTQPDRPHPRDDMMHFFQGTGLDFYRGLYAEPARQRRVIDGLHRMKMWCEQRDARLLVAIMPVKSSMTKPGFEAFHEQVAAWAADAGVACVDLLPAFQQRAQATPDTPLFADPLHPNAEGYRLAADAIAAALNGSEAP